MSAVSRVGIFMAVLYLGGVLGIFIGVTGGGEFPLFPLLAGIVCVFIGIALTVVLLLRRRNRI
ncbi:hypothetical protein ACFWOB_43745 [Streptomyces sp. NPDC058420]|uniref:hypothetical protein n=1 Tax=Streptomyces sp. NPDC058420 TaxID=3346489 RepID=UPI00364E77E9